MSSVQRRILAVSSGGGHWVQMLRLLDAFQDCNVAYVCVNKGYSSDVPGAKFYDISDATRFNSKRLVLVALQLFVVIVRFRPDVVVTTGAAPGLLAIGIAKIIFGVRTVWIDSIANCEQLSTSGRLARRFADRWITQWPHLAVADGPMYWGAVL